MDHSGDGITVIFIAGSARSGSTVLDRVLGQVEGFFSVGEFRLIWEEGFAGNYLCECGKPFRSCSFWNAVVEEAFGGFDHVDVASFLRLWRAVDRIRNIPQLAFPELQSYSFRSVYTEYLDILSLLYRAIHKLSRGKVIVDSSKTLSHGLLLNSVRGLDLRVIHLVRDSRAVAFSMQRKKRNPAAGKENIYLGRQGVLASARDWLVVNGSISWLAHFFPRYVLLRYEDFAEQPRKALHEVFSGLGLELSDADFIINKRTVKLSLGHMVSGNPMRFQYGEIELRPDTVWKQEMPISQRLVVSALTWPLLLKYGYLRRG